jgi:mRNA interferase RelE/StbE
MFPLAWKKWFAALALTIEVSRAAEKVLSKIGRDQAARIVDFLYGRLASLDDPTSIGKVLKGRLDDFWCYRVGDWRLVPGGGVQVLVVTVGHRREIYKRHP